MRSGNTKKAVLNQITVNTTYFVLLVAFIKNIERKSGIKMKISIVIRCFNEEEHIGRLLTGIIQQTASDVEIIVVDSGSQDATVAIATQFPVKIISIKPEDFSFGRALNIGCDASTGDILVFASAHVYPVYCDWLEKLAMYFTDENVALVYGKQRGNDTTIYSEHQVFAKWFPDVAHTNQEYPFCNNANAAVRRSLWERYRYNETLTGLEDLDWANRIIGNGYRIAYSSEAEVIHVHAETWPGVLNRYRREAIAMKHILPQEKFSIFDFGRLFISNVIHDSYQAVHDRIFFKEFKNILMFRMMQFWGTYRGFAQRGPVSSKLKEKFYYPKGLIRPGSRLKHEEGRAAVDYSMGLNNGAKNNNFDSGNHL